MLASMGADACAVCVLTAVFTLAQMMFDLGADIISTDDVAELRAFVTAMAAAAAPRRQLARWRLRSPLGSADVVVRQLFGRRGLP